MAYYHPYGFQALRTFLLMKTLCDEGGIVPINDITLRKENL